MKRILIFSLAYEPFIGGAEVAVREITKRIGDFEFEMISVNLDGKQPKEERTGNINVHRLGSGKWSKYFFPLTALWLARKLHASRKFNAVWAIMANQAGLAAYFFKKKNKEIPLLLTLQEGDSEFDIWIRTFFIRPWYKNIYRGADGIQAISNFLAQRAKNLGAKCTVEVVPNGVDEEKFKNQNLKIKIASQNSKVIITTSRLEKKNAVDVLLRSIKELQETNHEFEIRLVILGKGTLENNLKQLAKDLGIEDSVQFLGQRKPEEVYAYLQKADVFVRPSRSEGLGNSFLEAMACGVPVIGTRVGGIPDFLTDHESGLFCTVDDPKDLAQKIELLLNDQKLYQKLSKNGKKLVLEKYRWENIAKRMHDIFTEIIS